MTTSLIVILLVKRWWVDLIVTIAVHISFRSIFFVGVISLKLSFTHYNV
jgi:hypothetical protein